MKKISCILLVDDDEPTNFIHQMAIEEADCCSTLNTVTNGLEALDYFKDSDNTTPEVVFLDINMPRMNGWQFLDEYKKLDEEKKARIVIVMLTTSLNPADLKRAKEIKEISDFRNKPLTVGMLEEIIEHHF